VVGMHSAPPFPNDQYRLVRELRDMDAHRRPQLYMDAGDDDTYRRYILEFHDDLVEQGVEHVWIPAPGGHNEEYWRANLERYLRWYGAAFSSRD